MERTKKTQHLVPMNRDTSYVKPLAIRVIQEFIQEKLVKPK